jgi:CRISPR-associated protein Csb2
VEDQLTVELARQGRDTENLSISIENAGWVKVHRRQSGGDSRTNTDKLGYTVNLVFRQPITGPVLLGESCHFGLGLFVPVE